MSKPEAFKPRILVDFDGVLHDYVGSGGWQGVGTVAGPPKPGALEWLNSLLEHFEVCIYSTRSSQVGGLLAMQRWIKGHWPKEIPLPLDSAGELKIQFPREKLPAKLTIDDRCLRFAGRFPLAEELLAYRPYDEAVAPYAADSEDDSRWLRSHIALLDEAAGSYRTLARVKQIKNRPEWRAQLSDIAHQVDALADEMSRSLPVKERAVAR